MTDLDVPPRLLVEIDVTRMDWSLHARRWIARCGLSTLSAQRSSDPGRPQIGIRDEQAVEELEVGRTRGRPGQRRTARIALCTHDEPDRSGAGAVSCSVASKPAASPPWSNDSFETKRR